MKGKLSHYLLALVLCFINRVWGAPERTTLLKFQYAPFPYKESPHSHKPPFFDVNDKGRRGHTSARGGVYWEDATYSDNRVLISIPPHFKLAKKPLIVVYLHGNLATLERDVRDRQRIPEQLADSGLNAILVAPQFAVDAQDSSPGHFADKDFFEKFLAEVADKTGRWQKNIRYTQQLKNAKVVIVAYSGGYQAAACALENGGVEKRIAGVALLDALYGQEQSFADFILNNHGHSFFVSSYTESARESNELLMSLLKKHGQDFHFNLPNKLQSNNLSFIELGEAVDHHQLLARAWTESPLTDLLRRVKANNKKNTPRKVAQNNLGAHE